MTQDATLWHNPRCSTSRAALARLRAAGLEPRIVPYLETGFAEAELRGLLAAAGLTPPEALRRKEPLAAELGLLAPGIADEAILAAMLAHPVLVERPFVATARGTALCRPAERIEALLPASN